MDEKEKQQIAPELAELLAKQQQKPADASDDDLRIMAKVLQGMLRGEG